MKDFSLLILTDHRTHSEHNSFYGLFRAFFKHPKIKKVAVASREYAENEAFFKGDMQAALHGYLPKPLPFSDWTWPTPQQLETLEVHAYDIVFLRLPEPSPELFFTELENAFPKVLFINRPSGILKAGSKAYLTHFPNLCPPLRLLKSPKEALELSKEMDIVLKPLRNYGGKGILKIEQEELFMGNEKHDVSELDRFWDRRGSMLAMKYLPYLKAGDKRTVVVNGHIQFSTVRYPPPDSWICNVSQGGRSEMSTPNPEEKQMAEQLSEHLLPEGIILFGFDTLVNEEGTRKLSEINVQSIGGIVPAERATGKPIADQIVSHLLTYAAEHHH